MNHRRFALPRSVQFLRTIRGDLSILKERARGLKLLAGHAHPLNCSEAISPIFIIGAGRSGNTLLRRILFNDPSLYIPPETYVLGQVIGNFRKHLTLDWNNLVRTSLAELAMSEDFHFFPTQLLRPLYLELIDTAPERRSVALILDRFYMFMAQAIKPTATRWGDKTPFNIHALDSINATFPNAKYVWIIRNGYDCAASYVKMGRYERLADAAERWVFSNAKCSTFARANPDKVVQLRYEDLVSAPQENLAKVCRFLGLTYRDVLLAPPDQPEQLGDLSQAHYQGAGSWISTRGIHKGVDRLEPTDRAELAALIEPVHPLYGYDRLP